MDSNNELKLATDALSAGHITKDEYAKIALRNNAISQEEFNRVTAPGWKRGISNVGGFALETGGLVGGEMLGAAGGAEAVLPSLPFIGPAAITLPYIGKTVGGSGGEAVGEVGKKELDTLLGFRKQPSGQEIWDTLKSGAKRGAIYSAAGQAAGPFLKGTAKVLKKPFSIASGLDEKILDRVIENPRSILPEWMGGDPRLGKAAAVDEITGKVTKPGWGEAEKYRKARLPYKGAKLSPSPEEGGIYDNTLSNSKAAIDDIGKALKRGEKIVAREAVPAYEWVNSRIRSFTPGEGGISELTADAKSEYFALKDLKNRLAKEIERDAPEFWNRIVEYGKAMTKEKATAVLPGGYGGRYLARRTIPVAAGLMGPQVAAGVFGAMSPIAQSAMTAGLSSGYAGSPIVKILDSMRKRKQAHENTNP